MESVIKDIHSAVMEGQSDVVKEEVQASMAVTEDYARQIGMDGYSPDASRAVAAAKSLVSVTCKDIS
jgi:hypothetical protein